MHAHAVIGLYHMGQKRFERTGRKSQKEELSCSTPLLLSVPCRAVPALQHTAPAVPAERTQPMASPRPLGMLSSVMGRASKGLGLPVAGLADADSPINGLLYISGNIAGSRAQPTGEVAVRLYDAAVGA